MSPDRAKRLGADMRADFLSAIRTGKSARIARHTAIVVRLRPRLSDAAHHALYAGLRGDA